MNLDEMTLPELKELAKEVNKAIASFEARQKKAALEELEQKAAELGFSLSDLVGAGKAKKTAAPKYRNPEDASQTWTGRGRTPRWVIDLEASGKSRDDALI